MYNTIRMTGHDAIRFAAAHSLPLGTYTDPTSEARMDVDVEEARNIAREDPSLVYLDVAHATGPQYVQHQNPLVAVYTIRVDVRGTPGAYTASTSLIEDQNRNPTFSGSGSKVAQTPDEALRVALLNLTKNL